MSKPAVFARRSAVTTQRHFGKRDLLIRQKRPTYQAKEAYCDEHTRGISQEIGCTTQRHFAADFWPLCMCVCKGRVVEGGGGGYEVDENRYRNLWASNKTEGVYLEMK